MPERPAAPPPGRGSRQRPVPRSAARRKRERRREAARRALAQPRRSPLRLWVWNGVGAVVIVVGVLLIVLKLTGGTKATPVTPTATATPTATSTAAQLAGLQTAASGATVDGIQCQTSEQLVYHIHAHLAIYVNGTLKQIPEGIGIAPPRTEVDSDEGPYVTEGKCFYWLHTHTDDGIIHIESPAQKLYTLGDFFDIWGQTLSTTQVGPASGTLHVYVDGQPYTGDPRAIQLTAHELIQIDVGTNVPPAPFTFPVGL